MPDRPLRFVAPGGCQRLDRLVAEASGAGRRSVRRWMQLGLVRVDGHRARPADVPVPGAVVLVDAEATLPPPTGAGEVAAPRMLFENDALIVVAKPANRHCERGRSGGSVAEWLMERYGDRSSIGARAAEAGLVHRLDRDTSGVLAAARTAAAYSRLRAAFRSARTRKEYLALVAGQVEHPLHIDRALVGRGTRMAIAVGNDDGQPAETVVQPLESGRGWSLVLATMRSGVRHQVRVHLASAGFPLIGDELYGGPSLPGCGRSGQLLHALRLRIDDEVDVSTGPPGDFLAALARLRRNG